MSGVIRFDSPKERTNYAENIRREMQAARRRHDNKKRLEENPPDIKSQNINIDNIDIKIPDYSRDIPRDFLASAPPYFDERRFKKLQKEDNYELQHSERQLQKFMAEGQRQSAETNRLVNIRKSPTADNSINTHSPIARIYSREWSQDYKIRVEARPRHQNSLSPNFGERVTSKLTDSAARKIIESGAWVQASRGGFSTFLTLTFNEEKRKAIYDLKAKPTYDNSEKIDSHGPYSRIDYCKAGDMYEGTMSDGPFCRIEWATDSSIGKEVSRFVDGIQKMYQRGWAWEPVEEDSVIDKAMPSEMVDGRISEDGEPEKLDFLWVAENPNTKEIVVNQVGEPIEVIQGTNPHVHMLLRWRVKPHQFLRWAKRLEGIWGNGFAKLEKIKKPEAATGYLLKALGYMTKGNFDLDRDTGELISSQGIIKGNRYSISAPARAPSYQCVAEFEAEKLGAAIFEIGTQLQIKQLQLSEKLKSLKSDLKHHTSEKARWKNYKVVPTKVRLRTLDGIETAIEKAAADIKKIEETRKSSAWGNKWQLVCKTKKQFTAFMSHAITNYGWRGIEREGIYAEGVNEESMLTKSIDSIKDIATRVKDSVKKAVCHEIYYIKETVKQVSEQLSLEEFEKLYEGGVTCQAI